MLLLNRTTLVIRRQAQVRCTQLRLASLDANKEQSLVPRVEEQREIQPREPAAIKPIKQKLIKRIPVEFHGVEAGKFNEQTEWYPIFKSPYLNTMRIVIKCKVYLTAFSLASSLVYACQVILGNASNPWKAAILSAITLAGLTIIGDFARRLIVQIYVSQDLEYVRFCRFTFFGKRRDMVVPRECIVRLTEINPSQRAPILNVKFMMPEKGIDIDYDHYEFYELGFRIPIGLGGVLDKDKLNLALGKILVNKPLN